MHGWHESRKWSDMPWQGNGRAVNLEERVSRSKNKERLFEPSLFILWFPNVSVNVTFIPQFKSISYSLPCSLASLFILLLLLLLLLLCTNKWWWWWWWSSSSSFLPLPHYSISLIPLHYYYYTALLYSSGNIGYSIDDKEIFYYLFSTFQTSLLLPPWRHY